MRRFMTFIALIVFQTPVSSQIGVDVGSTRIASGEIFGLPMLSTGCFGGIRYRASANVEIFKIDSLFARPFKIQTGSLTTNDGDQMELRVNWGIGQTQLLEYPYHDTTWRTVTFVLQPGSITLFADGIPMGSFPFPDTGSVSPTSTFTLGGGSTGNLEVDHFFIGTGTASTIDAISWTHESPSASGPRMIAMWDFSGETPCDASDQVLEDLGFGNVLVKGTSGLDTALDAKVVTNPFQPAFRGTQGDLRLRVMPVILIPSPENEWLPFPVQNGNAGNATNIPLLQVKMTSPGGSLDNAPFIIVADLLGPNHGLPSLQIPSLGWWIDSTPLFLTSLTVIPTLFPGEFLYAVLPTTALQNSGWSLVIQAVAVGAGDIVTSDAYVITF